MTGYLTDLVAVVWALRYVLLLAALLVVTALWLEARHDRDVARSDARRFYREMVRLRTVAGEPYRCLPAGRKKALAGRRVVSR